jgi:hypothetical protein
MNFPFTVKQKPPLLTVANNKPQSLLSLLRLLHQQTQMM